MILSPNNRLAILVRASLSLLALLFALAACSIASGGAASESPTTIRIVTTTNILADWAKNIGGDHVEVFSLVPAGADPHAFQPGAQDIARIADADLVLSVGLGLEESWLQDLLQNAARDPSTIMELAETVDPIEFAESHREEVEVIEELNHVVQEVEEGKIGPEVALAKIKGLLEGAEDDDHAVEDELPATALAIVGKVDDGQLEASEAIEAIEEITSEGAGEHEGHGHGNYDPHFWFDPLRVRVVVDDIAARLSALDPDRADAYRANAFAYDGRLDELHELDRGAG